MKIAQYGPNLNKAANRSKDRYFNGEYVKKNGDALQETHTWYGASGVFFKGTDSGASQGALIRATNNSIFDYNASRFDYGWGSSGPSVTTPYRSRAVVVCGKDL